MINAAKRIEQIVKLYEDICFLKNASSVYHEANNLKDPFPPEDGVMNWKGFRNALLHIKPGTSQDDLYAQMSEFMYDAACPDDHLAFKLLMNLVPKTVSHWTADSRRVFTLDGDLQTLLNATSLDGVTWDDIRLPFNTFVVSLAKPIVISSPKDQGHREREFDTIMVCQEDDDNESGTRRDVLFWLLSSELDSFQFTMIQERRDLIEAMRRERWHQVTKMYNRLTKRIVRNPGPYFLVDHEIRLKSISGTAESLRTAENRSICDQAIRIVMGMCLYLGTLPPSSPHVSAWEKNDETILNDRGGCISNDAEVCTIGSEFKLTSSDRTAIERNLDDVMRSPSGTVSPHFRRGYFRRPVGQGQNPEAKRTDWVRPTVINKHLLKDGELPKGASTILLK